MFIVSTDLTEESKPLIEEVKKHFGDVPPHFQLLASLNTKRFAIFIQEIFYLFAHPNINPDLFAFLRFYVATKEEFSYCKNFNSRLLLSKGYTKDQIEKTSMDIALIPLDERHRQLAKKAIKAIYDSELFSQKDIEELYSLKWSLGDIYDAIDHAAFLLKNGRIFKAFIA